jgi:hypothetical protein
MPVEKKQDLVAQIREIKKDTSENGRRLRSEVLSVVLEELFCTPAAENIFPLAKLTSAEKKEMSAFFDLVRNHPCWILLVKDITQKATEKMFLSSTSFDEMLGGKFMLYTLDILNQKMAALAKEQR